MSRRIVDAYDPPPASVPDTSRYVAAMTYRASREAKALRTQRWYAALMVLSLGWGILMTWDNRQMAEKLVEVARVKPVYRVEQALDGHQRLVLLDTTLTVTKGARLNAVEWFVRWMRQIGTDPVTMARDRAAARARLLGDAPRKWDALMAGDLDPSEGWTRDVASVRIEEREFDPGTGTTSFHVVWTETVYRAFKPESRHLMSAAVVTVDGAPREGALDGVGISGFSVPSGTPMPLPSEGAPRFPADGGLPGGQP